MRAVNLIPDDQRGGGAIAARSGGAAYLVLGLLAGLAILAGLYGISHHQLDSRRAEAASLTAQAQQIQQQAARLAPYTTFMAMREQRMQAVQELVGSRFDWSSAMGELSRVLPANVALTAIQGAVGSTTAAVKAPSAAGSATVTSATPPGTTPSLTLSGCAASQSVVAQALIRLRLVEGVSSVVLASSTKSSSGSAGSGSGACPGTDPVFSIQVDFSPLPAVSAVSAAASAGAGATTSSSGGSPAASGTASSDASATATGGKAR